MASRAVPVPKPSEPLPASECTALDRPPCDLTAVRPPRDQAARGQHLGEPAVRAPRRSLSTNLRDQLVRTRAEPRARGAGLRQSPFDQYLQGHPVPGDDADLLQ